MPIRHHGRAQAVVNIRWINSSFNATAATTELLPMLRRMVAEIEEALDQASIEPVAAWSAGAPRRGEIGAGWHDVCGESCREEGRFGTARLKETCVS
jgi:hypothetical protein